MLLKSVLATQEVFSRYTEAEQAEAANTLQ